MTTRSERSLGLLPPITGNPYLDAYRRSMAAPRSDEWPGDLLAKFGFAVPDDRALRLIAAHSPAGVVEIGAGLGYWARLLHERGVDVVAYDLWPPPSSNNVWFAGRQPWFPVLPGDERIVATYPERTLLLVWPTRNEDWAASAAQLHLERGGQRLVYVGEAPGGRTGDLRLHALLDLVGRCLACAYNLSTAPCTCGVTERWRVLEHVPLSRWDDRDSQMYVFEPARANPRSRRPAWFRRRQQVP